MALLFGVFVSLAMLGLVAWVGPGMFTSGGGLFIVSALAHTVGTAVATLLASRSRLGSTPTLAVGVVALACGLLLVGTTAAAYAALAHAIPRAFATAGGLILCCGIGYVASASFAGRVYPAWNHQAGPIALAVLAITTTYLAGLRLLAR